MGEFYYNNQWRLPNNENKDKSSNYSMSFDSASSQYIQTTFNIGNTSTFSVSMWANTTSFTTTQILIDNRDAGSDGFNCYIYNNTLQFRINGVDLGVSTSTLSNNTWFHLGLTYDGVNKKIYFNGSKVDETTQSATLNVTNTLRIGTVSHTTPSNFFNGKLDHVAIFDYALSSSQVTTLYGNSTNGVGNPMSLSTKPVAYYKLGEKAAFNGSEYLVTNAASEVFSPYALEFDGTNDYIDCGNNSSLQITQNITISVWFKIDNSSSGTYGNIITKWISGDKAWSSYVTKSTGILSFWISSNGSTQTKINSTTSVNDGNWHHFVGTNDGSNNRLYIDGVLEDTGTTGNIYNSTQNVLIGKTNQNSFLFSGAISNVSIWNAALTDGTGGTPNQISELYNSGKPSDLNTHSAASNLVSWWQLGANSSFNSQWTVLDEVGTNNGTSNGMAENDLVNGPETTANGLSSGMGSGDNVIGEAPYSTANALSIDMGVEARTDDTPS